MEGGGEIGTETPCCHAETKSDTEDDFEMIFANGKKYKRYFKRHIVFQRHVCRQVAAFFISLFSLSSWPKVVNSF